jgi:hypothetical protein
VQSVLRRILVRALRAPAFRVPDDGSPGETYRMPRRSPVPTLDLVRERIRPFLSEIERLDAVCGVHLVQGRMGDSGALGSYESKLYVTTNNDPDPSGFVELICEIRDRFQRHRPTWPFNCFGACRHRA